MERVLVPQRPLVDIGQCEFPCCLVEGCDRRYAVGCNGSAWSRYDRRTRKWSNFWTRITPSPLRSGHRVIVLSLPDGRTKTVLVYHEVLKSFVGPRPNNTEARHLDGNPANNWWWNLQWGTRLENIEDMLFHGTHGTKLTLEVVIEARELYRSGRTVAFISSHLQNNSSTVREAVFGRTWTSIPNCPPCKPRRHSAKQNQQLTNEAIAVLKSNMPIREVSEVLGITTHAAYRARRLCVKR